MKEECRNPKIQPWVVTFGLMRFMAGMVTPLKAIMTVLYLPKQLTKRVAQNPATWNLGSGGTPQKNDIVDVFGHLRRDLSAGSPGILWSFGGATTMSADGNSHNDFEYFRKDVTFNGSKLLNTGDQEGHTAWVFEADGRPLVRGDLLISVDFENGGTRPLGEFRVWTKKTDAVVATFNSNATHFNRPFDITVILELTSGATYGYAEIAKKGSFPKMDTNAINQSDSQ